MKTNVAPSDLAEGYDEFLQDLAGRYKAHSYGA